MVLAAAGPVVSQAPVDPLRVLNTTSPLTPSAAGDAVLAAASSCGVERWSVKTGTDPDAGQVQLASSSGTTVASLDGLPAPSSLPSDARIAPTETTAFVLDAYLTGYKLETDEDYHLVLTDGGGHTMIAEIPAPDCVGAGSPFAPGIASARSELDARYTPTSTMTSVNVPVRVRGVGFFDYNHGQTGVAPNAIELHPVLDITFDPAGFNPATNAPSALGHVTAIAPARVYDSRLTGGKLAAGATRTVVVAGTGGVPADATAVVANVTVTGPSASGYVTVWPAGAAKPQASSVNFVAGQTIANAVQLPVGTGGAVEVYAFRSTDVIVDVTGYFSAAGADFTAATPTRMLDTRTGAGGYDQPVSAGQTIAVPIAGVGPVPADATAVTLVTTVTHPSASSYLTVYPDGQSRPATSTLNMTAGQTVPNLVTVGVGTNGEVDFYNHSGATQVIADVVGYYAPTPTGQLQFTGLTPGRILDTRTGTGRPIGKVGPGQTITVGVRYLGVPTTASAVVLNLTSADATANSYVTAWATGTARPAASNLNPTPGRAVANLSVVQVGSDGTISLYNASGSLDLIADVTGYYDTSHGNYGPNTSPPNYPPPPTLTCQASMSNTTPARYSTVYVNTKTGVGGAAVTATAHYKTTDTTHTGTSDSTGNSSLPFNISGASSGYTVRVDVTVQSAGQTKTCATSFTPQ